MTVGAFAADLFLRVARQCSKQTVVKYLTFSPPRYQTRPR